MGSPLGCCSSVCVGSSAAAVCPSQCQCWEDMSCPCYRCSCNLHPIVQKIFVGSRSKQLQFLYLPEHCWRISHTILQRGFHTRKIRRKWTKNEADSCRKQCHSPSRVWNSTSAPKEFTQVRVHIYEVLWTLFQRLFLAIRMKWLHVSLNLHQVLKY